MTERIGTPFDQTPPSERFSNALVAFDEALEPDGSQFSGHGLIEAFLDAERAIDLLPDVPEDKRTKLALGLAGRAVEAATANGSEGTAETMRGIQERIVDRAAIRHGDYEALYVRRDRGELHGALDSQRTVYRRPDGRTVLGPATPIAEGWGHSGANVDLRPGETSGNLSPKRRFPPQG